MKNTTIANINNIDLVIFTDSNATIWVPIEPICKALQISELEGFSKIREDDILRSVVRLTRHMNSNGKLQEMICLPYKYIFGWLFTITLENFAPEARQAVDKNRIACYDAFFDYGIK